MFNQVKPSTGWKIELIRYPEEYVKAYTEINMILFPVDKLPIRPIVIYYF